MVQTAGLAIALRNTLRVIRDALVFAALPLWVTYSGLASNFAHLHDRPVSEAGFIDFHPAWLAARHILHHQPLYSASAIHLPRAGIDYSYPAPGAIAMA